MKNLLPATIVPVVILGGWAAYAAFYRAPPQVRGVVPVEHLPFDSAVIDRDIRGNEGAIKVDPNAALNWSYVSGSYLARSRESDDLPTAVKAEAAARKSLAIRKLGNGGAWNKLINSLLQEHRFKDALAECVAAKKSRVDNDATTLLRADCLLEIGRYDEAGDLLAKNPRATANASGETIVARLLDIRGKPLQAVALLKQAADEVDRNGGMPSNAISWFHSRYAMELAKVGRHGEAKQQYERALALYPRDYKSMAGLARLAAQDARWSEVVEWGNRSDKIAQMADVRALVGDAYAMLGDSTKAEAQYARVAELVGRPSGMNDGLHEVTPGAGTHGHRLDRQYAIYCADHGRDPEGAYAAALRDFDAREDIYAYDTLAWVCLQRGNRNEAAKAIDRALATNTNDPMVLYHGGVIFHAVGKTDRAEKLLHAALSIDPRFDGIAAPKARRLLSTLQAGAKGV